MCLCLGALVSGLNLICLYVLADTEWLTAYVKSLITKTVITEGCTMSDTTLSLELACYHAVHDYKGGVKAVAAVYGWNSATLQNKLNPTQTTHKLLASEVGAILELTQDGRILDALCVPHGAIWVDLGLTEGTATDMAMLDTITQLVQRVGGLSGSVHNALADGYVDAKELSELETATMRLMQAAFCVLERAKQFQ